MTPTFFPITRETMKRLLFLSLAVLVGAAGQVQAAVTSTSFDSLPEGSVGQSFQDGGISFTETLNFPDGVSLSFAIEDASGSSNYNFSGSASEGGIVGGDAHLRWRRCLRHEFTRE